MHTSLGPKAVKIIEAAVRNLFIKIRGVVLGGRAVANKDLAFRYRPELTLTGIFETAAEEEGVKPDPQVLNGLLSVADSYLTATEAKASARTVQAVQSFLTEAHNGGVETDFPTVLGGQLADVFADVTHEVQRIVETESTTMRNMSIMDGIVQGNALAGVDDPTVFFVIVRDQEACLVKSEQVLTSSGQISAGDIQVGAILKNPTTPSQRGGVTVRSMKIKTAPILRLTLDDGRTLTCSEDHPLPVRSGRKIVFLPAAEINDTHHIIMLEDLTSKGDRRRLTASCTPRPWMKGFDSQYGFWASQGPVILDLLLRQTGRQPVMDMFGISVAEWDQWVRPTLAVRWPDLNLSKGLNRDNRYNQDFLDERQREYDLAIAPLVDELGARINRGDTCLDVAKDMGVPVRMVRGLVKETGLLRQIKARGGRENWLKNRDLLIKKAQARGTPHFRGVSRPEQAVVDMLRAGGIALEQTVQIGNMKVDALSENIVIEYDGSGHNMRDRLWGRPLTARIDFARDKRLRELGYRVFRIVDTKDTCDKGILEAFLAFKDTQKGFGKCLVS